MVKKRDSFRCDNKNSRDELDVKATKLGEEEEEEEEGGGGGGAAEETERKKSSSEMETVDGAGRVSQRYNLGIWEANFLFFFAGELEI